MFQVFVQSLLRGEVTVGIVLTILLISGRSDPETLAFSLGGIGVFLLLQGFVPLSRSGAGRTRGAATEKTTVLRDEGSESANSNEVEPESVRPTTTSPCACSKRPFNRREYFARAAISSLVIMGTACLIYWFAPSVV